MSIRWVADGDQSGWEVWVKRGDRRRLFVARKFGGKDATQQIALEEERRLLAEQAAAAPKRPLPKAPG